MIRILDELADALGAFVRTSVEGIGAMGRFAFAGLATQWRMSLISEQMFLLGIASLPLVMILSCFTGFIAGLSMTAISGGIATNYMGTAVSRAVFSEMGPTFTALILAARIGSKISGELGSMRISEQIDAMKCLCLDPMSYLVAPRIIACFLMGPVIYIMSSAVAIVGAQSIATLTIGVDPFVFYNSMRLLFSEDLVIMGLVKSFTFVGLIGISGCYFGFHTRGGAIGVGNAIRGTVVTSSLLILFTNIIIYRFFI